MPQLATGNGDERMVIVELKIAFPTEESAETEVRILGEENANKFELFAAQAVAQVYKDIFVGVIQRMGGKDVSVIEEEAQ